MSDSVREAGKSQQNDDLLYCFLIAIVALAAIGLLAALRGLSMPFFHA